MTTSKGPSPVIAEYGDGALQSTGFLLDGEMHGAWSFYRKDGSGPRRALRRRLGSSWRPFGPGVTRAASPSGRDR
jgi:hypothetical protein